VKNKSDEMIKILYNFEYHKYYFYDIIVLNFYELYFDFNLNLLQVVFFNQL